MIRRFRVTVRDGEAGWLIAECEDLPGCLSQGRTLAETLDNIKDAIEGWLEVAEGRPPGSVSIEPPAMEAVVR